MTTPTAAVWLFLGLASFAPGRFPAQEVLPRIANPEALAIEMAKALVSGDRERFTALAATREEMEELLKTAQPPMGPVGRQEQKRKVTEILAERRKDFDGFQAMKKDAGFKEGAAVRFELIELDPIHEKDGMKQVRHSRVRMVQTTESGKEEPFLIRLDDMYLFHRGWAFTSVTPRIGKETLKRPNSGGEGSRLIR